jgi:hypothetical protein
VTYSTIDSTHTDTEIILCAVINTSRTPPPHQLPPRGRAHLLTDPRSAGLTRIWATNLLDPLKTRVQKILMHIHNPSLFSVKKYTETDLWAPNCLLKPQNKKWMGLGGKGILLLSHDCFRLYGGNTKIEYYQVAWICIFEVLPASFFGPKIVIAAGAVSRTLLGKQTTLSQTL